jgi:hypothetical protein
MYRAPWHETELGVVHQVLDVLPHLVTSCLRYSGVTHLFHIHVGSSVLLLLLAYFILSNPRGD